MLNLLKLLLLAVVIETSAQDATDIQTCLEILFSDQLFDSTFYKHRHMKDRGFFIEQNETILSMLNKYYPEERNSFQLPNGKFISIDSKGFLFVWGIERFLRVTGCVVNDDKISLEFQEIGYNGFDEKMLRLRKATFIKVNHWQLEKIELIE